MASRKVKSAKPAPKPTTAKQAASKVQKRPSPNLSAESIVSPKRPAPDIPFTSQASRKRRQPTCSMASLRNLETEVTHEENFVVLFGSQSDNHYTWGKTEAKSISAIKRKGAKGPRVRMKQVGGFPRGLFPWMDESSPEPIIPNSPDSSPILRIPLEIREKIYSHLLIYMRPIIVQHDWEIVEHKLHCFNSIIFVCKQISEEATNFLYRNNAFRAILRPSPNVFYYRDTFSIPAKFIPLFKNIIIQCERDHFMLKWFDMACASVKRLSEAGVALDALTIVTFPQRVGMSETAIGMEAHPVTFADFFYSQGQFMAELKKLKCKVLNVVIKKVEDEEKWRLLISLDLKYLHSGALEEGKLTNQETTRMARSKADEVEREMLGLKKRFEEVFENDALAQRVGKCRLMHEDETYADGLALANGICVGL